jgi:hypothetical protein
MNGRHVTEYSVYMDITPVLTPGTSG